MGSGILGQSSSSPRHNNIMLVFLALFSVAAAAPQLYGGYPYGGYGGYPVYPVYYQQPYPVVVRAALPQEAASTRGFITLPGFQTANANLVQDTATGSSYRVYLNGDNIAGKKYQLGVASSCTATPVNLGSQITAPAFLINGFYASGSSTNFNVDGSDGKTSVKTMFLTVKDEAGTTVGCTAAIA